MKGNYLKFFDVWIDLYVTLYFCMDLKYFNIIAEDIEVFYETCYVVLSLNPISEGPKDHLELQGIRKTEMNDGAGRRG
jgi:hypothetical protein